MSPRAQLVLACGALGVVGLGLTFGRGRRGRRTAGLGGPSGAPVTNPDDVADVVRPELPDAVRRARKAGARGPLEYVGAGMTSIVFEDGRRCWKTARRPNPLLRAMLEEEAEWLADARRVGAIRRHVVPFYRFHEGPVVIERACARGRAGRWGDESRLFDLHKKIEKAMIPAGWTAPEFKGTSYVIDDAGHAVLVDAGMSIRVGENLVRYVEGVLDGRRKLRTGDKLQDLAFYVRRERDETIPAARADRLLARLRSV